MSKNMMSFEEILESAERAAERVTRRPQGKCDLSAPRPPTGGSSDKELDDCTSMQHNIQVANVPEELVFSELLKEVRSLHKQLKAIKTEIYTCRDLGKLSILGAVRLLIKSYKALREISLEIRSDRYDRSEPTKRLEKIETILNNL
jgi:hypothetical protein